VQWTNAIAFLRIPSSPEPLDSTGIHPEQYTLVRRVLESAGSSVEDGLRRPGVTRGLRYEDFGVDEGTWRDLLREIAHPGRDPRPRLGRPELLPPDVDPVRLVKDRVVTGIVSNVASFGAFVDIGLAQDAMIHISEVSDHYVRDVREVLSVGQMVRAKILDASGQRLSLSLKNVPAAERPVRPARGGGGRGRGARGEGRDERRSQANVRAAQSRRDGLAGAGRGGRGGRSGPGGGGFGGGPGAGGRGAGGGHRGAAAGRGGRGERDERVDVERLNREQKTGYSPFAAFFKDRGDVPDEAGQSAPAQDMERDAAPVEERADAPPRVASDAVATPALDDEAGDTSETRRTQ
jgi:uncharacterized protein